MPHWLLKSAVHRAISLLPRRQKWNEFLQERVTKSLNFSPGEFEARLNACRQFLEDYLEHNPDRTAGFSALELGTGWYPTVPIGLYLCGASEIWAFDIDPLLRPARLKLLLEYFLQYDRNGTLQQFLPRLRPDRLARLREVALGIDQDSPEEGLEKLNIHILIRDAQNTGLSGQSADFFFSYSVLEYISRPALANILSEFKRLSRPGAMMVHYIDLFDQFSRFDKSITSLNFLKFSSARWNLLRSPLIPMNRLRISAYRSLVANAGFEITRELNTSAPPETLDRIHLAPEFDGYAREDLLVLTSWLVSKAVYKIPTARGVTGVN